MGRTPPQRARCGVSGVLGRELDIKAQSQDLNTTWRASSHGLEGTRGVNQGEVDERFGGI